MGLIGTIPLLIVPAGIYALLAFSMGQEGIQTFLISNAFSIPTAGGGRWIASWSDTLIIFSTLILFVEILKSTRPTRTAMIDNALSVLVFILCLIAFILAPGFGTTAFFMIMLMSVLDFMAGSMVMLSTATRTVQFGQQ